MTTPNRIKDDIRNWILKLWLNGEISGTSVLDSSWNTSNWTTFNSPTEFKLMWAKWLTYNGTNQYVSLWTPVSIDWTQDFSISLWVNIAAFNPSGGFYRAIFSRASYGSLDQWDFYTLNPSTIWFGIVNTVTTQFGISFTWAVINKRYHLVWTYNQSTKLISFYINGWLQWTSTLTGTFNTPAIDINIWKENWAVPVNEHFSWKQTQHMIFQRVLTWQEIQELYQSQALLTIL